jgi:hypothetical protein
MAVEITSIHESDNHGQNLLNEVVQLFCDLLITSGASLQMIKSAISLFVERAVENNGTTTFTDLGSLLRDCMEVICMWRRDVELVDQNGEPKPLPVSSARASFEILCNKANCRHPTSQILNALLEFGAVSIDGDGQVRSETPTFLLGRATRGGRLATDALIKHLEGFLRCVHQNVCSVSGNGKPKFDRACTVTVALELEPIFDRLVQRRGQEFIDSIDEWLERNTKVCSPTGRYVELGAGAYFVNFGERPTRKRSA